MGVSQFAVHLALVIAVRPVVVVAEPVVELPVLLVAAAIVEAMLVEEVVLLIVDRIAQAVVPVDVLMRVQDVLMRVQDVLMRVQDVLMHVQVVLMNVQVALIIVQVALIIATQGVPLVMDAGDVAKVARRLALDRALMIVEKDVPDAQDAQGGVPID